MRTGVLLFVLSISSCTIAGSLEWSKIATLPSLNGKAHPGLAGCFAGFHEGVLIVAGGANFPEGAPWEGGEKRWYKEIYLLHNEGEDKFRWESSKLELPATLAYGVSITTLKGVVCIGGNNSESCTSGISIKFICQ